MNEPTIIDDRFREYALALLRQHNLLARDKSDAVELEEVEDQLTSLWKKLDETQTPHLRGIGSDLNWVRRRGLPAPKGRKAEEVTRVELTAIEKLKPNEDWLQRLHNLRMVTPAILPAMLAYQRATCYSMIGLPELSEPFLELAIELARDKNEIGRMAFQSQTSINAANSFVL